MLLKKLTVTLIAMMATVAMAGGTEYLPQNYRGFYLEAGLGMASINWSTYALGPTQFRAGSTANRNTSSGFTYGGDVGFQFTEYWGIEWGAYDFATVSGVINGLGITVKSFITYGAIKLMAPLYTNFYLFGKFGVVYRDGHMTGDAGAMVNGTNVPLTSRYWDMLFGTGLQYNVTPNWSLHVQYLYAPGYQSGILVGDTLHFNTPTAHVVTVGVGYKFLI